MAQWAVDVGCPAYSVTAFFCLFDLYIYDFILYYYTTNLFAQKGFVWTKHLT